MHVVLSGHGPDAATIMKTIQPSVLPLTAKKPCVAERPLPVPRPSFPYAMSRSSSLDRISSSNESDPTDTLIDTQATFSTPNTPSIPSSSMELSLLSTENPALMSLAVSSLMSHLGQAFVTHIEILNQNRKTFCSEEYPLSFTGEEAIKLLKLLLPQQLTSKEYRNVACAFFHATPPLIAPVPYSEKSIKKNTLYDSSKEIYTLVEDTIEKGIPEAVYLPLTTCYTPLCSFQQSGCYAPCCPNRKKHESVKRAESMSSSVASSYDTTLSRAWSATVPREVLTSIPAKEVKRQEAIHELLYTEEDYLRDLNLLDELFAKPLLSAQCLDPDTREEFCRYVFNNYEVILNLHRAMYREMRDYQSLCQARNRVGFVDRIGDIFLRHVANFKDAYLTYGPHVVLAEYAVNQEMTKNMLFQNFMREKQRQAETRRLAFRHFLILPVPRIQRYKLLLDAILKQTPADHPDQYDLTRCIEQIVAIVSQMDRATENSKKTLRLYQINDAIEYKAGRFVDLQLLAPGRQLLHEGPLKRRKHMGVETVDIHVFLFDHLLLMTKRKKRASHAGADMYRVYKQPIPVELLMMPDLVDSFSLNLRPMGSSYGFSRSDTVQSDRPMTPLPTGQASLVVRHLGRHGADYMLIAESEAIRSTWKTKILEAKTSLDIRRADQYVCQRVPLAYASFGAPMGEVRGDVTCSISYVGANGRPMVAVSTAQGVWMGIPNERRSFQRVLSVSNVTQIGVLQDHHIFLVLADKILSAYPLYVLDPTAMARKPTSERVASQKLSSHSSFFNTGVYGARTLVISMKKKGMDSHFKTFEPVCGDLSDPKNAKFLTSKSSFLSKPPAWFRIYKEFYIGAESSAVYFLKARLVVLCVRGFEIVDLDHLDMNRNLPDLQKPAFQFVTQINEEAKPLGMFKCKDYYLLCYTSFAFLVDSRGDFVKHPAYTRIEWEGVPQAVTFSYPYIMAFDPRFIEVRHVETGQLIQILTGENIRCLHYRYNSHDHTPPIIHGCMTLTSKSNEQTIFHLTVHPPLSNHISPPS
ncbi:uncharacterized protein BYT42DRAFT_559247 [Radiomyces spectabilis]|uniref:uncharacterized protein n=1 Tax=Radiomyces spectabilis TaxID=64574 RepID=UPI00221E75FC|nr:uncharacterized protein BYT42DRAFT_559247 [Radiomyces spectabilis]KAI8388203.1 hypothetical protein BYT42DRAFT_559247 [Radiomyces spectabilis]